MTTIELELQNGQKREIEFDGIPTQEDIEEVAKSLESNVDVSTPEEITSDSVLKGGVEKNIDLSPSGLLKAPAREIAKIPLELEHIAKNGTLDGARDYATQKQDKAFEKFEKNHPLVNFAFNKAPSFLIDFATYGKINPLKTGNIVLNSAVNSGLQGGVISAIESLKDKGANLKENLKDTAIGTTVGGGIGAVLPMGLNKLAQGLESPAFQDKLSGAIEMLTSVPKKYTKRVLNKELANESILNGKFNEDEVYKKIGNQFTKAKRMLPEKEDFAKMFNELGAKAYRGFNKKQEKLEQNIREVLNKMQKDNKYLDVNNLRDSLSNTIARFSNGGEINPALETAGKEIKDVKRLLGILSPEEQSQALNGLRKAMGEKLGFYYDFDREAENIALDLLSQQTGKKPEYLRMILKAGNPQKAKQTAFETLMNEIEEKPFDVLSVDGSRYTSKFPELYQILEDSTTNKDFMSKLASRVAGRDFKLYNYGNDPLSEEIAYSNNELNNITNKLLDNIKKGMDKNSAYQQAFDKFNTKFEAAPDYIKELYLTDLVNLTDKIDDILTPKVKAIDLHNLKEMLYDKANYDIANSGIKNNVLKAMANDINEYLRGSNKDYAKANDIYKLLKDIEQAFGGSQGVNPNTIASKLMNYGEKGNILSNMDNRLRTLDSIVDDTDKFYLDTKALKQRKNAIDKLIQDVKSPNQQDRMNALRQLNELTNGNFYDDIKNINNFESLGEYNPLQGNIVNSKNIASKMRNFGSENNTLRGTDITLKDIDSIVDDNYKFYDELQKLSSEHNEVKDILKAIGNKNYERNPRLLSNFNDTEREMALANLQNKTGINFMEDLENTRAREVFEKLTPGQGGGSGSAQGYANLFRNALATSLAGSVGGGWQGSLTGALIGLLASSPKIAGKGTIKNLGKLYQFAGKESPEWLIPLLYGTGANLNDL